SRWLVVALLLAGTGVAALAPGTPAAALGEETPSEQAKRTGVRVPVPEKTTESEQVFANPDSTFTLETSAVPERARKSGRWMPIDTTLVRAGAVIAPKATTADIAFSAGGSSTALARITEGGRSLELYWPQALPEPVLSGSTATYREVFAGVDLVLVANAQSFSEVLVVKTAQAAANPALRKIKFGVRGDGVSIRTAPGGGFAAVDQHGLEVFTSPQPSMWDSGADAGAVAPPSAQARVLGPREGDQVAPMGVEVSDSPRARWRCTGSRVCLGPPRGTTSRRGWSGRTVAPSPTGATAVPRVGPGWRSTRSRA
ncbi:MAG: hypothetical protein ACRDTM_04320, partial [Micromonosporaceae bacterium]